jgi:hypothetical protein
MWRVSSQWIIKALGATCMARKLSGTRMSRGLQRMTSTAGPFVSPERFAVRYSFDWTRKSSGEHVVLDEVAVYTVTNGKISREEFLYSDLRVNGASLPMHLWGGA